MKVYCNGKYIDQERAKISVFDHGFLYGDAVFESVLFENEKIINLNKHLKRLEKSAEKLLITFPKLNYEQIIKKLININQLKQVKVRITLSRGINFNFITCSNPTLLIITIPLKKQSITFPQGSKVCTIKIERPIPDIKTTQILPSILARQKMYQQKCHECFFVNNKNEITEGSVSNVFFVKKDKIYTPPLKSCLPGTMQQKIFTLCYKNNIPIFEKEINYKDLNKYTEAFWTNAIVKIVPIKKIDKINFMCIGTLTKKIIKLFNSIDFF